MKAKFNNIVQNFNTKKALTITGIALIVLIVIIIIIFVIRKQVKKGKEEREEEERQRQRENQILENQEIADQLRNNAGQAGQTLTDEQLLQMALTIENCFGVFPRVINDDEDAFKSQLSQLGTQSDIVKLEELFNNNCIHSDLQHLFTGANNLNFKPFIREFNNEGEVAQYNQILSDKGIIYRF